MLVGVSCGLERCLAVKRFDQRFPDKWRGTKSGSGETLESLRINRN